MIDSGDISAALAPFARASLPRALWQLANTLVPFLALWILMAWSFHAGLNYYGRSWRTA